MFKKLRTVVYHVSDLQKAKEWYSSITGITPYFDMPFYVGFNVNGFELGLDPDCSNATDGNHAIVYWAVDDIDQSFTKLLDNGAKQIEGINDVGDGIQVASVLDLWGNAIGIIQEKANVS
jgi:predicted enzyme related to lactoylglutathione lyase